MMEEKYNQSVLEAKWGLTMDEAGVVTKEDRAEFIQKAEAELKEQLESEMQ